VDIHGAGFFEPGKIEQGHAAADQRDQDQSKKCEAQLFADRE
jgi:hypothetical protein